VAVGPPSEAPARRAPSREAWLAGQRFPKTSAIGGAVAARFVQVERRINTLLDLQLAADIPLLEPPR